jgi:hypothetical protein
MRCGGSVQRCQDQALGLLAVPLRWTGEAADFTALAVEEKCRRQSSDL